MLNKRQYTVHILITLVIIGLFIAIIIILKQFDLNPARKLPCHYFDSINITDGFHHENGDIIYKNITFPTDQYAEVNTVLGYDKKSVGEFVKVAPYYRGCLCNRKKCMRLCCTDGCLNHNFESDLRIELRNNPFTSSMDNDFHFVRESCSRTLQIVNHTKANLSLTNEGVLTVHNRTYNHRQFCLMTEKQIPKIKKYPYFPCLKNEVHRAEKKLDVRDACVPYLLFISIPFTVATAVVYIFIPDLRNLHGKCLLCYLASLVIFESLFGWIYINAGHYVADRIFCKIAGYITYFSVQSAFLWLSVISFDLWWNFRKTNGFMLSENKRFIFYSIYAWGLSSMLTLITLIMDNVGGIPEDLQPQMATKNGMCFIKPGYNRRLLYFYLPQMILCFINVLFFVLTAFKIRTLQTDMKKVMAQGENCKHQNRLQREKENYVLFLRLFIVMGGVWIMESISFLVDSKNIYFFIFDMWNCLHGVLIFAFMVCKRRVVRLIKKRYQVIMKTSTSSITTNSSSVTYAPNNLALNQLSTTRDKYTERP